MKKTAKSVSWRAHPARERKAAAAATLLVIAAVGWAVAVTAGNAWLGVLGALLVVAALHRFFFPSVFTINGEGISARYLFARRRYRWRDVRRFVYDRRGGYLSTRLRASMFDAYGGMHILFDSSREELIERIRTMLPREGDRTCVG